MDDESVEMQEEMFQSDVETINLNDCDLCGENHSTVSCCQLSDVTIVEDSVAPSRAILTLPTNLRIRHPSPKEQQTGKLATITAREKISRGTRFGPLQAPMTSQQPPTQLQLTFKVIQPDGSSMYLDTSCPDKCNWMCLVLAATTLQQHNLIAYQVEQSIYFGALRDIRFHEELRVWYAPYYAKKLGISITLPSTGEAVERPRKQKPKTTVHIDSSLPVNSPQSDTKAEEELAANNPYQLRVRSKGKKRKKYEDFININDDEEESWDKDKKDIEEWVCSQCGETYQNQSLFAKHLLDHYEHPQPANPVEQHNCQFCQAQFSGVVEMQQHYMDQHRDNFMMEQSVIEPLEANNISDADAATILLEIEAKCDKNEDHQLLNDNQIQTTSELGDEIPTIHIGSGDEVGADNDKTTIGAQLFSCDICRKELTDRSQLLTHIRQHCDDEFDQEDEEEEGQQQHACVFCQKLFNSKRSLKLHQDRHTGTHSCLDCGKSYSTKETLKTHVCSSSDKSADNSVTCQICQKSFTKLKYLEKHIPVHTGSNACPICGKWLRSADSLVNHLRICGQSTKELDEVGYTVCPLCKETFLSLKDIRQHMFQHRHAFACDSCGARFRNKINLNSHICSEISNLECDVCSSKFEDVASLNQHRTQEHAEIVIKCDQCEATFSNKDLLESHECSPNSSSRKKGRKTKCPSLEPLVCSSCGALFSSTSSLNIHRRLHGDKMFSCEVCGKRFHRKDLMLDHWSVHSEPAIPCPMCNKKFKTKKSLDVHMSIHDGLKRFSCETCGKQFYQKGNLIKHVEVHNPSRKYPCDRCPKSFSTKEYLAIHLLEHTKGKTFICDICGKSFIKDHQLRAHQRMFHANVSFTCSLCGLNVKFKHSLKRHLRKKHMDKQDLWCKPEQVDAMMMPCEADKEPETATLENEEEEGETEVVLAVSGIGSEALQQALVSGAARIQHGSTPNTIEITLPVQDTEASDEATSGVTQEENHLATTHIIQLPLTDDAQNEKGDEEKDEVMVVAPAEEGEEAGESGQQFQITLDSELDNEIGTQIALDNEDQQILAAGGEVVLVNGVILKQGTMDDEDKVFFYVVNSSEASASAAQPFETPPSNNSI